jgi:hypothetical protein
MQTPALCATHLLLSVLPFFGFFPWQMPEQHVPFLPWHALPTSTHRNAFVFGFGFFFFLPFLALAGSGPRVTRLPRAVARMRRREPAVVSVRVTASKRWEFMV